MRLYGIKSCDTCRKALKSLEQAGHAVTFTDVRESPLGQAKLRQFHDLFGDDLLNTRSTTWRGLSASEREEDVIKLLDMHPTLMKRPVIEAVQMYLGWKKDVQDALL